MRIRLFALALLASLPVQAQPTPITLDQAMAHPDWIGTPVESAWWAWDSQNLNYSQKRNGSPIRDVYAISRNGGTAKKLEGSDLSNQDGSSFIFDAGRQQALFIRNGDVFLRNLKNGALMARQYCSDARINGFAGRLMRTCWNRLHYRLRKTIRLKMQSPTICVICNFASAAR